MYSLRRAKEIFHKNYEPKGIYKHFIDYSSRRTCWRRDLFCCNSSNYTPNTNPNAESYPHTHTFTKSYTNTNPNAEFYPHTRTFTNSYTSAETKSDF